MSDTVDLNDLPYVPLVPYNGTGATGGDALSNNFNIWYEVCRLPYPLPVPSAPPLPGWVCCYTTPLDQI